MDSINNVLENFIMFDFLPYSVWFLSFVIPIRLRRFRTPD